MKDKILRLIHAYIQDDEAINGAPKVISTHNGSQYEHCLEGVFIMNSKNTQKPHLNRRTYHNDIWVDDGCIFEYPKVEVKEFDYYSMTFSFENQPPIQILNRSEQFVLNLKGFGQKKNNFLPWSSTVELTFVFTTSDKPVHYLKCGTLEFDITDAEVEEIYNEIENRRSEIKKSAEMVELNKRFEKYGIQ